MKNIFFALLIILLLGGGYYFYSQRPVSTTSTPTPTEQAETLINSATTTVTTPGATQATNKTESTLGSSKLGNKITAYHYGTGSQEIVFVGGIHGGYEWNTVLVAYELMDYLKANPNVIPKNITVSVIPVLNPDGLKQVVGTTGRFTTADVPTDDATVIAGRFNANTVDLNRNFDCDWKAQGTWQTKTVSGGTAAFSEPESKAIKGYVDSKKPTAVVVWYSAGGGVFASSCHNGVAAETNTLTKTFATASGYKAYESFDFYATTGDMVNWLAKNNIPAISVLLTNHTDTEWTKNKAGVDAVLKLYTK